MPQDPSDRPAPTGPAAPDLPAPRQYGRTGRWVGGTVAVLAVAALGLAAWWFTGPGADDGGGRGPGGPAAAASGPQGGASRPGGGMAGAPGMGPGGPGGPGGGAPRGAPPTTVGVAVAQQQDLSVTLEALGTVVPLATVRVRPQVSGPLQQVLYREGQAVRQGELLAQIDPRPFELALQQAAGQRMRDEAQLDTARVTLQRYQQLLAQDSIARQEVDTQAALVRQLEAAVAVDKAAEGTARLNLSYTRITAPIAGRVGLRPVDVGNVVTPGDANGVAVITQMAPIDVQFALPQDQVGAVLAGAGGGPGGMAVRALDRNRAGLLEAGSFLSLDNQVDTSTGTIKAKARFANREGRLFPNQFVNVQLQLRTIAGAVVVPVAAIRQGPQGEHVFVVNADRTVSLRPVRRGQSTADVVQVAQGLQAGERVVTDGADRLRDGSRVLLPGERPRGPASVPGGGAAPAGPAPGPAAQGAPAAPSTAPPATATAPGAPPGPAVAAASPRATARSAGTAAGPAAPAAPSAAADLPTPEQRQRMLAMVAGDPEQLERRKRFLEALDRGEPQAVERWRMLRERMQQGGGAAQ